MCILNICWGGTPKFCFTKQPEPDLFRKIQIIKGLQTREGFESQTFERVVFKKLNRLRCLFFHFFPSKWTVTMIVIQVDALLGNNRNSHQNPLNCRTWSLGHTLKTSAFGFSSADDLGYVVCAVWPHLKLGLTSSSSGLPWRLSRKESTCQYRRLELDPWVGKTPRRRKQEPIPVFWPGKSHEGAPRATVHGMELQRGRGAWGLKSNK